MYGECQASLGNSAASLGNSEASLQGRTINSWLFNPSAIQNRYSVA